MTFQTKYLLTDNSIISTWIYFPLSASEIMLILHSKTFLNSLRNDAFQPIPEFIQLLNITDIDS